MTAQRYTPHGLVFEGAPHGDNGERLFIGRGRFWGGVGGEGRGKCACGALSPVLPSAVKRKAWHREHKAEVSP
jgi:hypothetical protein